MRDAIDQKQVAEWIFKAWRRISKDDILKAFDECGYLSEEGKRKIIEEKAELAAKREKVENNMKNDMKADNNEGMKNENYNDYEKIEFNENNEICIPYFVWGHPPI